jgi:hypothetical protein
MAKLRSPWSVFAVLLLLLTMLLFTGAPQWRYQARGKFVDLYGIISKISKPAENQSKDQGSKFQSMELRGEEGGSKYSITICLTGCNPKTTTLFRPSELAVGAKVKVTGRQQRKNSVYALNIESLDATEKQAKLSILKKTELIPMSYG